MKTEKEKLVSEEGYCEFKENCDEIIEKFDILQCLIYLMY